MPTPKMPPTPVLKTSRLILRPLCQKDAPIIQRRFPRWEIVQYLNANIPWPYPPDGAATHVAECLAAMARGEKSHWAITLKGGKGELIGRIDLWPDDGVTHDQRGFWLDPEFQGRGLMMEAVECVTDYAFRTLGWPHLWLSNVQENQPSRRIKERQGARLIDLIISQHVGGEATHMVWLLTHADWVARRPT